MINKADMDDAGAITAKTPSNRGDEVIESKSNFTVAKGEEAPVMADVAPVTGYAKKQCNMTVPYKVSHIHPSTPYSYETCTHPAPKYMPVLFVSPRWKVRSNRTLKSSWRRMASSSKLAETFRYHLNLQFSLARTADCSKPLSHMSVLMYVY